MSLGSGRAVRAGTAIGPWLADQVRLPAGWRAAVLARAVAVATATGLVLNGRQFSEALLALGALAIVAATASLLDLGSGPVLARLIPVGEACVAGVVIFAMPATAGSLLVYVAVPALVAGVRLGPLSVLNALLASILVVASAAATLVDSAELVELATGAVVWLGIGVLVGMVAALQNRRLVALQVVQARHEPARRAAGVLYELTREFSGSLDPISAARRLAAAALAELGGDGDQAVTVLLIEPGAAPRPVAHVGTATEPVREQLAVVGQAVARRGRPQVAPGLVAVPLRAGDRTVGSLAVAGARSWGTGDVDRLQHLADEHAVPLEAALLLQRVRDVVGTEERNRLARDLHDGAIQEIAGLGYLVDDLLTGSVDATVQETARQVRAELSRVVRELRHATFDLRHGLDAADLTVALTDYAEHVHRLGDLRVHLDAEATGAAVAPVHEAELLRIAQEAVTNVRKHAAAENVWIRFRSDGEQVALTISDDGIGAGSVAARDGHFGLASMAERAARIGAVLRIEERPGGGTCVSVGTAVPLEASQRTSALENIEEWGRDDHCVGR